MSKHKTYSHQSMGLAKLRLKNQYSLEELDAAEIELHQQHIITRCRQWPRVGHEDCVRLRRVEGLTSVPR